MHHRIRTAPHFDSHADKRVTVVDNQHPSPLRSYSGTHQHGKITDIAFTDITDVIKGDKAELKMASCLRLYFTSSPAIIPGCMWSRNKPKKRALQAVHTTAH